MTSSSRVHSHQKYIAGHQKSIRIREYTCTYSLISSSVVQSNGVSPSQLRADLSASRLSRYCTHSTLAVEAASCSAVDCVSVLWCGGREEGERDRGGGRTVGGNEEKGG